MKFESSKTVPLSPSPSDNRPGHGTVIGPADASPSPGRGASASGSPEGGASPDATSESGPKTVVGSRREEGPPVSVPDPGPRGCVDRQVAAAFQEKLEAFNARSYREALREAGYTLTKRSATARLLGERRAGSDERLMTVGATEVLSSRPVHREVELALKDQILYHPVGTSPRMRHVNLHVCGVAPCNVGRGAAVEVVDLVTRLEEGERAGGDLQVVYEAWRANFMYESRRRCGPPPP